MSAPAAPEVSVVLPVFRSEDFLAAALDRLGEQRGVRLEVIVVDDGSPDGSAAIAEAAAARDARIRVIRLPENQGVAAARERGVAAATAEWIWFVDGDDDWSDDAAARMLATATATGADVVVAAARFVYQGGETRALPAPALGPDRTADARTAFAALLDGTITGHLWNKLFRRRLFDGVAFTRTRVHSDLPIVATGIAAADRVAAVDATVYDYRLRSGSIITTTTARAESLRGVEGAVRAAAERVGLDRDERFRYFLLRFIVLSAVKDAELGPYAPEERRRLVDEQRRRIRVGDLRLLLARRDVRRFALAITARSSRPMHRALLRLAER